MRAKTPEEIEQRRVDLDNALADMLAQYRWLKRHKRNAEEVVRLQQDIRVASRALDEIEWVLGLNGEAMASNENQERKE